MWRLRFASLLLLTLPAAIHADDSDVFSDAIDDLRPKSAKAVPPERMILLAPGGPLVIDADITVDGKPLRAMFQDTVEEMMKAVAPAGKRKVTWKAALRNPGFARGRYAFLNRKSSTLQTTINQYDSNGNGFVEPPEVVAMVERLYGGAIFSVMPARYAYQGGGDAPVRRLLDTDKDESLSAQELAAAEGRLKSRDADDNDILELPELMGLTAMQYRRPLSGVTQVRNSLLLHISASTHWRTLYDVIDERYGSLVDLEVASLPLVPQLAKTLDANNDRVIDPKEISQLAKVEPHLRLAINFGEAGKLEPGISVKSLSSDLKEYEYVKAKSTQTILVQLPGVLLRLTGGDSQKSYTNYNTQARAILARYDANKNNYLESREVATQSYYKRQFANWDADNDGKVFLEELANGLRRNASLTNNRVATGATDQGNKLFTAIDISGDGRLNRREMRSAGERLKEADKNGDGQVTLEELPTTIRMAFGRGNSAYSTLYTQMRSNFRVNNAAATARSPGPSWFLRMDRNGDGDLTLREFLGDRKQFDKLDTNNDGFIDSAEADALPDD